ncbi:MAG TPA: NAD-dependent epimerase/dehydratase family protein [Vicinamibacteria bacterium]
MKTVVTGVAGFIGSHLADSLLADGHEVTGIDAFLDFYPRALKERNLQAARGHASFRLVEGAVQEMNLSDALEGAAQVFHLAAQAGVRSSWGRDFALYTEHNVLATQRVLEAALEAGVPRVVYASSSSVYGDAALPLREDSPCRPLSPYGVTKLAGEHLGRLYERNYGLPVVSLRYFTVYGPRQRPDMAFHRFLRASRNGDAVSVFGDGEQTRDFTFVADAVAATRAAANSERSGRVYNIGGGERVSVNEVLRRIERLTGRPVNAVREPAQKGDVRDTSADTAAAREDLGFRSTVTLTEGLARQWAWMGETA